jgi:colanic acid/amylovoran biosynthesis glycosyltransferase
MPQSRPVRLIYVTASMPFGPDEQFLAPEAHELIRRGLQLLIVPRSPRGAVFNQDASGLDHFSIREPLFGPRVLLSAAAEFARRPVATVRGLAVLGKSESLPVFARNLAVVPKALWLARIARKWRADHMHAHWARTTATMTMIASRMTGIPWSLTLHRGDIAEPNLLAPKIDAAVFSRFISESGVRIAESHGGISPSARVCVVHMGVVLPSLHEIRITNRDPLVALCPAHLYPVKGHEYLIKAMAILRDSQVPCSLWVVGEGELRETLQRQVQSLDLGSTISLLGQVPHERIAGWYRDLEVDAVVLPSIDLGDHLHEGIPVALMEAMAHGIPVVSTDTGGIPELLGEGAGVMVPARDPEALAAALENLVRDPDLRLRLGIAGRRRVEEGFAIERTTGALAAFIEAGVAAETR